MDSRVDAVSKGGKIFRGRDSTSMLGSGLNKSTMVVVPTQEYQPGDYVTFKNAYGGTTTHQVTHTKPGHVFTKGTFNKNGDGWIPLSDVVGKVTSAYKKGK